MDSLENSNAGGAEQGLTRANAPFLDGGRVGMGWDGWCCTRTGPSANPNPNLHPNPGHSLEHWPEVAASHSHSRQAQPESRHGPGPEARPRPSPSPGV
ncbi:hypothetical protein Afil01_52210 [Actinorhabdospora filicis]|uniref:Uncharacterized protein n=1 Tax=Actinorhabdospora filicis TaxID=1785913 RepID=A0A9W6SP31_9ACTN|nr:hypothetical protein Afil01_52210 [Actinorhabdospora filicis]